MDLEKHEDKWELEKYDLVIIDALRNSPNGLRWNELLRKTSMRSKRMGRRLAKLKEALIVERIVVKGPPLETHYKLRESTPPTENDLGLIYDALDALNYLQHMDDITSKLKAFSWTKEEEGVVEETYSRLYPYYLWILSYGARAESEFAREKLARLYSYLLKNDIKEWINPNGERYEIYRKMIEHAELNFDRTKLAEFNRAKRLFVTFFPKDLRKLAESFFKFYFFVQTKSRNNLRQEFRETVSNRAKRRKFEDYFGEKIPKHTLLRFLGGLNALYNPREWRSQEKNLPSTQ